jgi:arabinofuranosyltransferase
VTAAVWSRAMSEGRLRWVLLAAAGVVLVVHSLVYNFVTDDAYISFVFSRNFAEHGELTFNLGSPVEGYTNFLWTFVLGLLMVIGIPPEISSRVLGTACGLASLYVVFRTMERTCGKTWWTAVPSLLLACSSGFACWTSGGLETQLFTLLVAVAIDGYVEAQDNPGALRRAAIALALGAMTRPEGLLVAAVLGVSYLITRTVAKQWPWRDIALAAALFLGVWGPWFAWRYWYYGWLFPNTYYVKATGPWLKPILAKEMRDNGWYYIWVWLKQTRLLYALPLAAVGLGWVKPRTPRFALAIACALLALVYVPYTVSVGGDFMGLHRFIMPLFVVAAIAVTLGVEKLASLAPQRLVAPIAAAVLCVAFAATQVFLTYESLHPAKLDNDRGIDSPAYLMMYTENRARIGRAMASCFRDDDFSIVGGAGAQPYYARMRGIDVYGLVSDRIAHEEPRVKSRAGHTKWGSEPLLLQYDPTFVFACYLLHGGEAQPMLGCAGFWLARGYEEVTMHIPGIVGEGEYYTFLAKKARDFQCPGRVH